MKRDWKAFGSEVAAPSKKAPSHLTESILSRVHSDLNPGFARVLAKLGVIHALVSIGTLSICPQFGLRVFGEGMGIMHWFMDFGEIGCAIACGTFFIGSSIALAATLLSRPEWRAIRSQRILSVSAIVLLSLGAFRMMNGEFYLEISVAWLIGALLTGTLLVEGIWRMKYKKALDRVTA